MKLGIDVNEVVLSNVGTTGEFKIRNSAKAFKILSDGLYSNKIKAVIRELSCNAVDSHVAANKADTPFEVHLPTVLEPWFSVRDFGLGLNGDQVENIYTTYFESTKTESNDFIGALGLGSKSPFSYTENFTVTAIKDGTCRIYSAFINEMGVPSIAEMEKKLTDEGNGVEVKFSVTERYDYNSFRHEAINVFKWFKNKPVITGIEIDIPGPNYKEKNIVPGVHTLVHEYESWAVMGNISYPLSKISEPEKHFGHLSSLLSCGLVIEFGIGELDFAASREELSFVPLTISSIRKRLIEINAGLMAHFKSKIDALSNEWAKAEFLYNESSSKLYSSAVKQYVSDTNFALYDPTSYLGKKVFKFYNSDLSARGLSFKSFRIYGSRTERTGYNSSERVNGVIKDTSLVPVSTDVVIVLNDLKTGCEARARYSFIKTHSNKSVTVFCISHTSEDIAARQVEYNKLLKELHNPPTVIKASDLQKKEVVKRKPMSTDGILRLGDDGQWVNINEEISDKKIYYYVCLNGFMPQDINGNHFPVKEIHTLIANSGIKNISDIVIHGVRKLRIKDIAARKNWIWVENKLKEEIAKVSDLQVRQIITNSVKYDRRYTPYTNMRIANQLKSTSDYAIIAAQFDSLKNNTGNPTDLSALCVRYGRPLEIDKVQKEVSANINKVISKYPMLSYLNYTVPESVIVNYITTIDSHPGN